jgi:hypothetical protein
MASKLDTDAKRCQIMPSKHIETDAAHFIDIEAMDEGSDTTTGPDSDNGMQLQPHHNKSLLTLLPGSVQETEDEATLPPPHLIHGDDMDLADDDEGPHVDELAAEIQARYKWMSRPRREFSTLPEYPILDDPSIWRIRVKVLG